MKEVFLSHAHEDKILAQKVKEILEANGISGFVAHMDVNVSVEWRAEILQHLETSSALIAIVTPNFAKSAWANQEVGIAFARKLSLIPLMFEGSELRGVLEMHQGKAVSETNLEQVVKSAIPTINHGVPSSQRRFYKNLADALGKIVLRWQNYKGEPSTVKWTPKAIEEIRKNFGSDKEKLLELVSSEPEIDFGVKSQTHAIMSQIDAFVFLKIDFNTPYFETYPQLQELDHKGEEMSYTAQALQGWLQKEKLS